MAQLQVLDEHKIAAGASIHGVLKDAIEEKCIVVGVHKSLASFPAVPFFALFPTNSSNEAPDASFSSLTFKSLGSKRDRYCEDIKDVQSICEVAGVLLGERFVPQSISPSRNLPGYPQQSLSDHMEIITVEPYGHLEATHPIVVNIPRGSYLQHCAPAVYSEGMLERSPETSHTMYRLPFKKRPHGSYVMRLPGLDFRMRCKLKDDGCVHLEREQWTPFDPRVAAEVYRAKVMKAKEDKATRQRTNSAPAADLAHSQATDDSSDQHSTQALSNSLNHKVTLSSTASSLNFASPEFMPIPVKKVPIFNHHCFSLYATPFVPCFKQVQLGLRLSADTPAFIPKASFPLLCRWSVPLEGTVLQTSTGLSCFSSSTGSLS